MWAVGFWVQRLRAAIQDPGSLGLCSLSSSNPKADFLVVSHSREFLQVERLFFGIPYEPRATFLSLCLIGPNWIMRHF